MAARFMSGTPDEELERMMQTVPGFQARKSGKIVSRFPCGATGHVGPESREMISIGELMMHFAKEVAQDQFTNRVMRLLRQPCPLFFLAGHGERFRSLWTARCGERKGNAVCAALYLLAADRFLWGQSVAAIRPNGIRFKEIPIYGVDMGGYVLFHTAKLLYQGTGQIRLMELMDTQRIDDDTFRLVLAAFLIRRYGAGVLMEERRCRK